MNAITWSQALAVGLGAMLGALLRWLLAVLCQGWWHGFPVGTLLVNCIGGFCMGIGLLWFETRILTDNALHVWLRLFFLTGFLGGFTTFSAFSGESLHLLQKGALGLALSHSAAHVLGALFCTWLGWRMARLLIL